jgi:hypothetical protein
VRSSSPVCTAYTRPCCQSPKSPNSTHACPGPAHTSDEGTFTVSTCHGRCYHKLLYSLIIDTHHNATGSDTRGLLQYADYTMHPETTAPMSISPRPTSALDSLRRHYCQNLLRRHLQSTVILFLLCFPHLTILHYIIIIIIILIIIIIIIIITIRIIR